MRVGIVGAGIMGRTLALACLNAGWQVQVFDKSAAENSASAAAAGLLLPYSELDKSDSIINVLGNAACKHHWPSLLAQLNTDVYFNMQGSLTLCHPREQAELQHFMHSIMGKLPDAPYQRLNQQDLSLLEPALAKFPQAYFCREEGNIDNQQLLIDLKHYLQNKGVQWIENAMVTAIKSKQIELIDQVYETDVVIDCRGLGAKHILPNLHGVRGELVWLHAPQVNLHRPLRFLHPRHSLYIVPRPHDYYIVGASEIYSDDNSQISVRTMLELLTTVFYIHPEFAEARIVKSITHCRPTLPHHVPEIHHTPGLIAVNGLYRHGILIAPALAQEIVSYLQHNEQTYPTLWKKLH